MTRCTLRSAGWLLAAALVMTAGCGRSRPKPDDFDLDDGGAPRSGRNGGSGRGAGASGSTPPRSGTVAPPPEAGRSGSIAPPPPRPNCGNGVLDRGEECDGDPGFDCGFAGLGQGVVRCDRRTCEYDVSDCTNAPVCAQAAPVALPRGCFSVLCQCDPMTVFACDAACLKMIECSLAECRNTGLTAQCLSGCFSFGDDSARTAIQLLTGCAVGSPLCFTPMPPPPPSCGDGRLSPIEECEPKFPLAQNCQAFGFDSGELQCDSLTCTYDTSNCGFGREECGNGVAEGQEYCDSRDLRGMTCGALGLGNGALRCTEACTFDANLCQQCGDGRVSGDEQCDGQRMRGASCLSLGFAGGALLCDACTYNTSECSRCGDGSVTAGENCDGSNLQGATCETLGFGAGGSLGCSPNSCHYDTRGCTTAPHCGDGVAQLDEQCDGPDHTFQSCESLGYRSGALECNPATCRFDTTNCLSGPDAECTNLCIDEMCQSALDNCAKLPGCQRVSDCLDGCRGMPSLNCVSNCIIPEPDAALPAIVAADCVSDCVGSCR